MDVIRVFPHKTSYTPDDPMAYVGMPPIGALLPAHDEIHISCVFTWDKRLCEDLAYQWQGQTEKPVLIGGPAYNSLVEGFEPGMYVKHGVVFTTRGCNNNCPWCCVPGREGKLRELPIKPGNIIQDNNFLQASKGHKNKAFDMLRSQRGICFKGGLEADLIDDHFISNIQSLRIKELWLACDTKESLSVFKKACKKLVRAGFNRNKIRCYALIGDDMQENENRCREIYYAGAMPFAQLYRDFNEIKTEYNKEWRALQCTWSRPAATEAHMKLVGGNGDVKENSLRRDNSGILEGLIL